MMMCIGVRLYKDGYKTNLYIPNQWIVFFARSDWLISLGIVSAIRLLHFGELLFIFRRDELLVLKVYKS